MPQQTTITAADDKTSHQYDLEGQLAVVIDTVGGSTSSTTMREHRNPRGSIVSQFLQPIGTTRFRTLLPWPLTRLNMTANRWHCLNQPAISTRKLMSAAVD